MNLKIILGDNCNISRLKYSFISTLVFVLAAHAFIYFNFIPQHDGLNHALRFAGQWEVSLGRFMLPVYGLIQGNNTMPWVIGMSAILFITCTTYLITQILEIVRPIDIAITAGFLSTNLCITELHGTFLFTVGAYTLSLLCATLGIYITIRQRGIVATLLSTLCLMLSLGLYQAFIPVALVLYVAVIGKAIVRVNGNMTLHQFAYQTYHIIPIILGIAFYLIGYRLTMKVWQIQAPDSYNSLSRLSVLSVDCLWHSILNNYKIFGQIFFGNNVIVGNIARYCNITLVLAALLITSQRIYRKDISAKVILFILPMVAVFPLITRLPSILMKAGRSGFYTSYAMFLAYPILLTIIATGNNSTKLSCFDYAQQQGGGGTRVSNSDFAKTIAYWCFIILLLTNIRYSNGAYTIVKIMYDRAVSSMTRVLWELNNNPTYIRNKTRVVIIGEFNRRSNLNPITYNYGGYNKLSGYNETSITYNLTFSSMASLLGEKMIIEKDDQVIEQYKEKESVRQMPSYPDKGYCQLIEDRMVVKLSPY